ncbi:MAG: hypothetical protein E7627_01030 [Ruminococcaceae bacterium]|nr:hypothetical protein [Oscillospiraceae bacterium]
MAKFDISVKQIAREALPRLIDNLVFPNLVYKENIEGYAAKQGDTVSVRCPVKLTATEFDATTGVNAEDLQKDTIDVTLDHLATVDMQVGAIEAACDFDSVVRMFIEPAAAALAEKINAEGLALYKDIPNIAGEAGKTPAGLNDIAQASYALDMQKVPAGTRRAIWSPLATSYLKQVPAIVNAEKCGSSSALRTGAIGKVFGIENYMSQAICNHETTADGLTLTLASAAFNFETINLNFTGEGALVKGDVLIIDGKPHTCTRDGVVSGSKITVTVYPAVTATSDAKVAAVGNHAANLVFHPDAFAFITRPLQAPAGVESYVTTYNGIALRVVRGYDMKYKREMLSMDVLYAFKTIYPELAVRYLG